MPDFMRTSFAIVIAAALAGCGGGSGTSDQANMAGDPPQNTPSNPTSDSPVAYETADGTPLVGIQATLSSAIEIEDIELRQILGAINANELKMNDGSVFFVGDFAGAPKDVSPGVVSSTTDASKFRALNYTDPSYDIDFLTGFDGDTIVYLGVIGPALTAAVADTGTAVYRGEARGDLSVFDDQIYTYTLGDSTITADFADGKVDVVMASFNATLGAPVDEVQINGMTISGDRFEGGTLQLLNNGAVVSPLGTDLTASSGGIFSSGSDAAGIPNEAGGMVHATGADGTVVMGYVGK